MEVGVDMELEMDMDMHGLGCGHYLLCNITEAHNPAELAVALSN